MGNYEYAVVQHCGVKEMDQSSIYPDGTPRDKRKWNFHIALDTSDPSEPSRAQGNCILSKVYSDELVAEKEMTIMLKEILNENI
jgi:hypothetical protein